MYTISKFVCLLVCIVGVYGTPTHSETCSYWGNVASGYSRVNDDNGARHVTCQAHQNTCNGFNCSGIYNTRIPLMQHLNLSFCFGLTLNHCDNPPSVDYYLQLASPRNAETYERVKVNETKPIGNLSFGTALLHIRPYLFFIYTKESDSSILFEAKIKCKVTTYGFEEWPDQLQVTVFQSKRIPYTPCSGTESVPVLQKPPKCIPYKPSSITTSKPHTGKPYSTKYPPHVKPTKSPVAPTKSKTLGKPCTPGAMQGVACEKNETCVGNGKKGICECQFNFKKEDGFCKPTKAQGPIFPTWNPHVKKTTKSAATVQPNVQVSTSRIASHQASGTKINMTALIVGSILGGLIVIVLIATVVIFVIRKRRMYYRGHQLLLSEEDTDVVI